LAAVYKRFICLPQAKQALRQGGEQLDCKACSWLVLQLVVCAGITSVTISFSCPSWITNTGNDFWAAGSDWRHQEHVIADGKYTRKRLGIYIWLF